MDLCNCGQNLPPPPGWDRVKVAPVAPADTSLLVLQMFDLLDVFQPIIGWQTSQDFKAVMSLFEKIVDGQTFGHMGVQLYIGATEGT